jgi:hypothetical protein
LAAAAAAAAAARTGLAANLMPLKTFSMELHCRHFNGIEIFYHKMTHPISHRWEGGSFVLLNQD